MTHFKVSDEAVEVAARAIYDQFDYPPTESGTKPKWVERGNSLMQVKARNYARAAIEAVLPVMFERVLYADNEVIEDAIDAVNRRHVMRYVRAWNDPIDTSTTPLFRIKEPK